MIIYYDCQTHSGFWLKYEGSGDFGVTSNPTKATPYKTKRECNKVIARCARNWRVDASQFHILKIA